MRSEGFNEGYDTGWSEDRPRVVRVTVHEVEAEMFYTEEDKEFLSRMRISQD